MARWLFGDQLGPWFLPGDGEPVIVIESLAALRRQRWHRQKLHLVLSAMRHRTAELGERAIAVRATGYRTGLAETGIAPGEISVCEPTSHAAEVFVRTLGLGSIEAHPGFAT